MSCVLHSHAFLIRYLTCVIPTPCRHFLAGMIRDGVPAQMAADPQTQELRKQLNDNSWGGMSECRFLSAVFEDQIHPDPMGRLMYAGAHAKLHHCNCKTASLQLQNCITATAELQCWRSIPAVHVLNLRRVVFAGHECQDVMCVRA